MKYFRLQRVSCAVLCLILLLNVFSVSTFAKEKSDNVIKVGSFEGTYNIVNDKGERSGYGYEYLQTIAGYAGWTYDYVESSWEKCFDQLDNGNMDLLGGISYTQERANRFLFSDMPMGEERYYIYTEDSNAELSANNLDSFNGKNIGVLVNHIPEEVLIEWENKNGLQLNHINISSNEDSLDKIEKKEIDCFVSNEQSELANYHISPVTSIGESSIYFAINKNRPDIKKTLDDAMRRIKDDNPFYIDDLYRRYLSAQCSAFLSKDEKDWIARHGTIKIGYLNNDIGVSAIDPDTGELTGIICDYVELARNCLQGQTLNFELKGYNTRSEQLKSLHNGDIDLIFHVSQNPYSAEKNEFVLSDTVWTFNMAAITSKDTFDENDKNSIAVVKDNFALKAYISYNYPAWIIEEFDTMDEAVQAVKDEKVDCFACNSGITSNYLKSHEFYSVFLTKPANVSFAIRQKEPILLSIMNKTLSSVSTEKFSGAVVSYSNAMKKVTFADFIKDNLLIVALFIIVFFALVLYIILTSLKKSRKAEAEAKESTNETLQLNKKLEENKQELQVALTEAQNANEAKTIFLNNMSHDIRTPINGIIGMLSIIQKSENDPDKIKYCLNKIDESSKLLLSLISDVLDMAKLESDTVTVNNESINLYQVCEELTKTVMFQAEEAGINVTYNCDDYQGLYVWSNAIHLKKILMNLFTNSMKYNKPHGSIQMSMKTLEKTSDFLTCEFKIKDTGIGMSEEFIQNELFTPFVQADNTARSHYNGTGLGMPIVKQLVEKMGGTIHVESQINVGTCFTVIIPFQIDNETRHHQKELEDKRKIDLTGIKILLVEDNELNMEIAEFMLNECGAQIDKATNGQEALTMFSSSEKGEYDVILMDIMMPVMNGLVATKEIRKLDREDAKKIPIIAMTANAFREDVEKCLEAGMNEHLAKPLDMHNVIKIIAQYCPLQKR